MGTTEQDDKKSNIVGSLNGGSRVIFASLPPGGVGRSYYEVNDDTYPTRFVDI